MSKVNILSSQSSNSMEEPQYTILKPCEVLDLLQKEVCKVHSVVGNVSKIKLRSLLNKYKWDVDVFLEKFYDNRIAELKIDESEEFSEETSQDSAASPPADVSENRKRHSTKAQPAEPVRKSRRLLVLQDVNLLIPLQTEETMKTCEICFDEKPFKVSFFLDPLFSFLIQQALFSSRISKLCSAITSSAPAASNNIWKQLWRAQITSDRSNVQDSSAINSSRTPRL